MSTHRTGESLPQALHTKRRQRTNQHREEGGEGCRTLKRGLDVLDLLSKAGAEGMRVVEICKTLGLERAPVYRLLSTLLEVGYASRSGRYHYTATSKLTFPARETVDRALAIKLQPVLEEISERLGDAVFLVVREANISHCIARQLGTHPVQVLPISIGNRQPLGVGAAGLALLAALAEDEIFRSMHQSALVLEQYGGMTTARLKILLGATQERGWSVVANHATRGVLGVGVAVLSKAQAPIAAVSVASTVERMPKDRQRLTAHTILEVLIRHFPHGV